MARALTTGFPQLITPGLRKVWFSTISNIPKEFRQLFGVIPPNPGPGSPLNFFEDLQVASLATAAPKPQGQSIQYDIPVEGNKVRATPYTFGKGFRITEEMSEDELYSVMNKMTGQLGAALVHQIEVQAHRPLNGGFSTAGGTGFTAAGFDSLALFNSAHTLLRSSGTRPNRFTTDLDLSHSSLEQALDIFHLWVNHSNMPDPRQPAILVVPPQLQWIAKELTESELKPYTGNNEINALSGQNLQVFIDHWLTDPDSWFLLAPKEQHTIQVWMRREPKFAMGDDFDTGDMKAKGTFRMATLHGEPDGTFGSAGA